MNTITINTTTHTLALRTTENTYEVKTRKNNSQYIALSYDITENDIENAPIYRLKIYIDYTQAFDDNSRDIFEVICEKAYAEIKKAIVNHEITLQKREYQNNEYYTIYKLQKGKMLNW